MSKLDLFDLNKPTDLYRIILAVYGDYVKHPTEKDFLLLVLGFTHLREWIAETGYDEIREKQKAGKPLSEGEQFFTEIYDLPSFKVVQELCNRGKHHITRGNTKTSKLQGLRFGIGKFGDRFDQTYFLIDGEDSRDCFIELMNKYNMWFAAHG